MAHSARQNDSFWKVKWVVLKCKMNHFANVKNVKKIQVLCFQYFGKLSNFAYLRPQVFYFRIIDSQSTFSDFLSKEFRTISASFRQRQQALPPSNGKGAPYGTICCSTATEVPSTECYSGLYESGQA